MWGNGAFRHPPIPLFSVHLSLTLCPSCLCLCLSVCSTWWLGSVLTLFFSKWARYGVLLCLPPSPSTVLHTFHCIVFSTHLKTQADRGIQSCTYGFPFFEGREWEVSEKQAGPLLPYMSTNPIDDLLIGLSWPALLLRSPGPVALAAQSVSSRSVVNGLQRHLKRNGPHA